MDRQADRWSMGDEWSLLLLAILRQRILQQLFGKYFVGQDGDTCDRTQLEFNASECLKLQLQNEHV